ncbi:MAG: cytochrome P450 [Acidimicrobiales bacterium]|nr:cytochrome P450 [Acidimicrobiales bacterium]
MNIGTSPETLINVSDPGALPFVDIQPTDFGDLIATTRRITSEHGWIVSSPAGPVVLGYPQARQILRDPEWFSVLAGVSMLDRMDSIAGDLDSLLARAQKSFPEAPTTLKMRPNVLSVEGEDHRRLRRLVNKSFTSGGADRLRPFMKEHASNLINQLVLDSGGDLVDSLCRPYPIPIICRLLGANDKDWQLFDSWADTIFSALDADAEAVISRLGEVTAAQHELDGYVNNLIDERSKHPQTGLIDDLISNHEKDDRLDRDELVAMVEAVLLAGTDTTRNQLGAMLAVLADHPKQYQELREDPSLIPAAVEEALRFIGAVRSTARLASRDLIVDGVLFPAGTTVIIGLHAAGLSESGESNSYRFQITRERSCPHLAFGSGAHHCLGAFLARAELQEALAAFVEKVPAFKLASPVSWKPLSMGIWGPSRLEIEIHEDLEQHQLLEPTLVETIQKPDDENTSLFTSSNQNIWISESAVKRKTVRATIPKLIQKPTLPPLLRLTATIWAFGSSLVLWRLLDHRGPQAERRPALYKRLRQAAERLGPTYVKLAQLISAAEGVFPEALVAECGKCRDRVRPESWRAVKKILTNELGPIEESFKSINERPLAAASIAQVHAAELLDGTQVVVKVQRPGIRQTVTSDLRVMAWLAPKLIGRIPIAALSNPPALVELFAETICEELDFKLEVANLFEVDRALRSNPRHQWEVPAPYLDLVTEKVIVMSRISGKPLSEIQKLTNNSADVAAVFRQMVESLLEGAVIHGIFHGDFHAGNVFLGQSSNIGLVDFGITGRLDGHRRTAFLRYVVGLMTGDLEAQVIGIRDLGAFPPDADVRDLIRNLQLDRVDFDPLDLSEEEFVEQFQDLLRELLGSGARIPKELMLFVKNFAYLSTVVQILDPDMDLLEAFADIAGGFLARNGVRVATEIGFSVSPNDASDHSLKQAFGLKKETSTLTWRELGERRESVFGRLRPSASLENSNSELIGSANDA